jgi:hypothetical protein
MPPTEQELWRFLPWGYLLTVALEMPVLLLGLAPRHLWQTRWLASFGLTACTYPIVVLVLPLTLWSAYGYLPYIVAAETFAPVAECFLFWWLFNDATTTSFAWRDYLSIIVANLVSFLLGGWLLQRLAG